MDVMEVTPLPSTFLHLPIVLLFLCFGLVVLRLPIFSLSFVLWVGAALDSLVRCSQTQMTVSFVSTFSWFWWDIDRPHQRMRCPKNWFMCRYIYVDRHGTWAPDVFHNIWYLYWFTRYGIQSWKLTLFGLFLVVVWSILYTSHHNFQHGSIVP